MIAIQEKDIAARLAQDNSWWTGTPQVSPFYAGLPKRLYFEGFRKLVANRDVRRAVILMGPRRVGKTVMLFQAIQSLLNADVPVQQLFYVSIDTPTYTGLGLEKLLHLAAKHASVDLRKQCYVFFDEIQYLKDWERHLKSLVDTYPEVKFIASGSAAAALRLKSQESGAGRFTDFILPPLSFAEFVNFKGKADDLFEHTEKFGLPDFKGNIDALNGLFVEYLNYGGYPEAVFSQTVREDSGRFIRNDIIYKVLLHDLPSLYGISDIQELNSLFTHLAYQTGNEISLDNLSQASGLSKNTIKRYIEYLEAAFLIARSRRLDHNAQRFKKEHAFKIYLTNPSMYAALFSPITESDPRFGHLVETAFASQLLHGISAIGSLHYARWKKGEIDVVILSKLNNTPEIACEIKWSDRIVDHQEELSEAIAFCRRHNPHYLLVTTRSITHKTVTDGITLLFTPCSITCYLDGLSIIKNEIRVMTDSIT